MIVQLRATSQPANTAEHEVAALYRAHFGYVWQVLQKLGVEDAALDDAAHDVFLVAHRRWRDFENRSSARTWLFGVARRVAYRYRRADFRRRRRRAALALVPEPDAPEPDVLLQRKRAWHQLLTFLDDLDPPHREVFLLGEIDGSSRTRMGHVLGISPNTAYSRLRAARRRFADAFPDPERRRAVRTASATPSRADARRGLALLVARVSARSPLLGALLPTAGLAGIVAIGVVAVLVPGPRSAVSAAPHPPQTRSTETRTPSPRRDLDLEGEPEVGDLQPSVPIETVPAARAKRPQQRTKSETPTATHHVRGRADPPAEAASAARDLGFDGLDPAMASLARARRALHEHRPHEALDLLDRSQRLDSQGAFATERAVTRVWALCAAERVPQARAELRTLQRSGNARAYADVLSGSCVAELISSLPSGDQEG